MKQTVLIVIVALLLAACGSGSQARNGGPAATAATCEPYPQGSGPFVYVALGASDAVGFGALCPERDGYVPQLGLKMPQGAKVINLGIGGVTVKAALTEELPYAVTDNANVMTVWLAANDFRAMESGSLTLDQYQQQLDQLLGTLQSQTKAHIYVGNLPDLTQLPLFQKGSVPLSVVGAQTQAWNAAIATIVARHGDVLVDLYHSDIASHPEYIFADGFHPSTLGYQVLAAQFLMSMHAHGDPHA